MSGFQIGVLIWLSILTFWCLALRHTGRELVGLLVKARVLKVEDVDTKKPSSTTTYVPPDRNDPENNPFLKAGIEALKKNKQEDCQDG